MSVTTKSYLIAGVLASEVFKISSKIIDQYEIHDQKTGMPTGTFNKGTTVYNLHDLNGKLILENVKHILQDNIFPFDDWDETQMTKFGMCVIDYEASEDLNNIILGIVLKEVDGYYNEIESISINELQKYIEVVETHLIKYGFTGEIKIFLQSYCAY